MTHVLENIDWVDEAASRVIARVDDAGGDPAEPIVCASGISPSGPIHLGNLREVMTPHLVAEELRRRGRIVRHVLFWDDYDRLRKVPAGAPASFAEFIGLPLTAVPDPSGEYPSWSERWKAPLRVALAELKVPIEEVCQTERYQAGVYADLVRLALTRRDEIDRVLSRFRTRRAAAIDEDDATVVEATTPTGYWPYRPYCDRCGHDETVVVGFDEDADVVRYRCNRHPYSGEVSLRDNSHGKLVWKVDWPMRWRHEGVMFETGGVDHSTPGSSFTVGTELVVSVFGAAPPEYLGYSFVGTSGQAKLSGSTGGAPTPCDALEILEPHLVRWIYGRREPRKAITFDFGAGTARLCDEWDSETRRGETLSARDALAHARATESSLGHLAAPRVVVPFQTLASIVDVTADDPDQFLRVVSAVAGSPIEDLADLEPRLSCARRWLESPAAPVRRTQPRTEPDSELLRSLSSTDAAWIEDLVAGLGDVETLDDLTTLVYGIPKLRLGYPIDSKPNDEVKAAQRAFFQLIYRLVVSDTSGPRLPTLLLALGVERVRALLEPGRPGAPGTS